MSKTYEVKTQKKYPCALYAYLTGLTEGTFSSNASSKGWSSKGGLTLEQASEIIRMPRRNDPRSQWTSEQGRECIEGLKAFGIIIKDEKLLNEFFGDGREGYLL